MKLVIAGGTGQVGKLVTRWAIDRGWDVVLLSRRQHSVDGPVKCVRWDAKTHGPWAHELENATALINLAGRSVSCRYTEDNLKQMMSSRVDSTRVLGEVMANLQDPPGVWLQMSTATIYAHSIDQTNDELTGVLGGSEPDVPSYWEFSVRIAKCWEAALMESDLPRTRRVALRAAMVMTSDRGGIFDALSGIARLGAGGAIAGGRQKVSWIHGDDFVRAVAFLLSDDQIDGQVNLSSPNPLSQREFMKLLRLAWGQRVGIPATKRMAAVGAHVLHSDPELLLKSRNVVPQRLLDAGFEFSFPHWEQASVDLVARARQRPEGLSLRDSIKDVLALGRSKPG